MAPDKLRPGSAAAGLLWKLDKSKTNQWNKALDSYDHCIGLLSKELSKAQSNLAKQTFTDDDKWKETELPKLIQNQKHLTLKQLERLMIWKLRRGVFRPTLMGLIRRNDNKSVVDVTKNGFKAAELNVVEGLDVLCQLKGVGPATASVILSVYLPSEVPFMSDEAMDAILGLPRQYTKPQFIQFQKAMFEKSEELGTSWSPSKIEKALWCTAMTSKFENN